MYIPVIPKNFPLYVLEILNKNNRKMYQFEILEELKKDYGIETTRNTLSYCLSGLRKDNYISGLRGIKINHNTICKKLL